jgi:hypothetical protein
MEPAAGIVEFFEELGQREHEPLLAKVTGRVRFDLVAAGRPDRWLVSVNKGDTTVLHKGGPRITRCGPTGRCSSGCAAVRRMPWPRCCVARWCAAGMSSCCSRSSGSSLDHRVNGGFSAANGARDDREPGEDPGGQHLRGE